jgi:hypothetical protein
MFKFIKINILLQVFGIIFIFALGIFAQERTWKPFSPTSGGWTINAPGILKPDSEALKSSSDKGSYSYNDFTGFFAVIYRDSPKRWVPWKPDYTAYMRKNRDEAVKAVKGQLLSDEEFTNGTIKGREIFIRMTGTVVQGRETQTKVTYRVERARMFFNGKRFYVLLVVLPEEEVNAPEITNYLNSFTLK